MAHATPRSTRLFTLHVPAQIFRRQGHLSTSKTTDTDWSKAKPYSQIPGPKPLPLVGNFWRFLPFGTYGNIQSIDLQAVLFKEFGPIVKLTGTGKPDLIFVRDPEDSEKIYRNEGQWPTRRNADSIDYYRRHLRKDIFGDYLGVATTQGQEWQLNRSVLNQPLMNTKNIKSYHEPIQRISSEFIQRMRNLQDGRQELPEDFLNELHKWAFESIGMVALDRRIGCLDPDLKSDSEAQSLIHAILEIFDYVYKLDVLPSMWRYVNTNDWKRFVKLLDLVITAFKDHIDSKMLEVQSLPEGGSELSSILETLLKKDNGKQVAITVAIDLMFSGIDTTSISVAFIMYHLATNPDAQEKLHEELKQVMPNKTDDLPKDYNNSVPYLKACVKETQRLSPIIPGTTRAAGSDMVIKGYQIPKGTDMMIATLDMCRDEKNFRNPHKWIPERWLQERGKENDNTKIANPFTFLPFGFGPRMCIGRRLAELEIHTLVAKVFRNFHLSYHYGDLQVESKFLIRPTTPLKFQLAEKGN